MTMSSRRLFASLVCPSAPFLVPRSCHLSLSRLGPRLSALQSAQSFTTAPKKPSSKFLGRLKKQRKLDQKLERAKASAPRDGTTLDAIGQYRRAVQESQMADVMDLYPDMMELAVLKPMDTLETARLLHNYYRRATKSAALLPPLLTFADTVIRDLRERRLPPHTAASLHLISFFKDAKQFEKGSEFWAWLVRQNENYVDAAVYGAAIEMKAYEGKDSLEDLEEMYAEALARFPGSFAQYHLSPEAIVPDRSQPTIINGLPMSLLQGIMTARMLHGDWKNAYLALDTALRLFPTQVPSRMFELFILERPLSEGYTSFLLACRSGVVLKPDRLTSILNRLAKAQSHKPTSVQFEILEAMVNAMHAYVGAGGEIGGPHIGVLIKGLENILPEESLDRAEGEESADQLVFGLALQIPGLFAEAGIPASLATFGSLLGIAGKARIPDMVLSILKRVADHGHEISPITYRRAILAAGQMRNAELVQSLWETRVRDAESKGDVLDPKDWLGLARAARRTNLKFYVEKQAAELSHAITGDTLERVRRALDSHESAPENRQSLDSGVVDIQLQQLQGRIMLLIELIRSQRLLDFHEDPVPMAIRHRPALGTEEQRREIYEQLTTDPDQPAAVQTGQEPYLSATGIPFDELRFENWNTINEMLAEAEWHEARKEQAVDEAIRTGRPLQKQQLQEDLSYCFGPEMNARPVPAANSNETESSIGSADGDNGAAGASEDLQAFRRRILSLRNLHQSPAMA